MTNPLYEIIICQTTEYRYRFNAKDESEAIEAAQKMFDQQTPEGRKWHICDSYLTGVETSFVEPDE